MNKSDDSKDLFAALAKAQGEMGAAKKDATNPFFKSHYADLASIWRCCQEVLPRHGLAVLQIPQMMDVAETMVLETVITHASGQWISGHYKIKPIKDDPQGWGSAMSYARRYSLAAMLSIVTEDDDGEGAMGREHHKYGTSSGSVGNNGAFKAAKITTVPPADKSQMIKLFFQTARENGWVESDIKHHMMTKYNVMSSDGLTVPQLAESIKYFDETPWDKQAKK